METKNEFVFCSKINHIHCIEVNFSNDLITHFPNGEYLFHKQKCVICGSERTYTESWGYPSFNYSYEMDKFFLDEDKL